jgi:general stress protein 26
MLLQDTGGAPLRLWELIGDLRFALVTTRDADGRLHSRPLTPQNEPWNRSRTLQFFVSAGSSVAAEVALDDRVTVGFADLHSGRFVSLSGSARVRDDPPRQAELWSAMARAWFPGGADEAELRLLEVHIETAECWDMRANRMVPLPLLTDAVELDDVDEDVAELISGTRPGDGTLPLPRQR